MSVRRRDINFILRCERQALDHEYTIFDHSSIHVYSFIQCIVNGSEVLDEHTLFYDMLAAFLNQQSTNQLSRIKQCLISQDAAPLKRKIIMDLPPLIMGTILSFGTRKEYCRLKASCMQLEFLLDNDQVIQHSKLFKRYYLSDSLIRYINNSIYLNNDIYFLRFCDELSVFNCNKYVSSHNLTQFMKQDHSNQSILAKQLSYQTMWQNIKMLELRSTFYNLKSFLWFKYITSNLKFIDLTLPTLIGCKSAHAKFDDIVEVLTCLSRELMSRRRLDALDTLNIALAAESNKKNDNNVKNHKHGPLWMRKTADNCTLITSLYKIVQMSKCSIFTNFGFMFTNANQLYAIFGTPISMYNTAASAKYITMPEFIIVHLGSLKIVKQEEKTKNDCIAHKNVNSISFDNTWFTYPNIVQATVNMHQNRFVVALTENCHQQPIGINRKEKTARIWNDVFDATSLSNLKNFNFYDQNNRNETAINIVNSMMNWHHTLRMLIIQCNLNHNTHRPEITAESLSSEILHTFLRIGSYNQGTFYQLRGINIIISYSYYNDEDHAQVQTVLAKVLESIDKYYIPRVIKLLNVQTLQLKVLLNGAKDVSMMSRDITIETLAKGCTKSFGENATNMLKNQYQDDCYCGALYAKSCNKNKQ